MSTKRKSKFSGRVAKDAQRQQSAASNYGYLQLPRGVNVFKETPGGKVKLDIMPYVVTNEHHMDRDEAAGIAIPGELWYKAPFKLHRSIGASNDSYVCLQTIGKKCPICEHKARMTKEGAPKEETDPLRPNLRNLYVVIPIGEKDLEEKPYIWDISQYLFQNLLNEELEESPENEVFPDLEEGKTLRIRFDSKTIGTSKPFAEASRIDFEDRKEAYDEAILDDIPDLDSILKILSYKELEAKFLEIETDDDEKEEEKPSRKRKSVEEEEEEEEKPVRKRKTPDPEPEEEEEEEEKPVRKRKETPKEEPEEEEEKPIRKRKPAEEEEEEKPVRKSSGGPACPYGHTFGKDCEKFDDCETCKLWDDCIEAQDKMKK